jgi:hypothetical protein
VPQFSADAAARARIERLAMQAVFDAEHALGHRTKDVSAENAAGTSPPTSTSPKGWRWSATLKSKAAPKGRTPSPSPANEIRHGLNQKDKFVLAVVVVDGERCRVLHYMPMPFTQEPDWAEASKNLDLGLLLQRALAPAAHYL